MAVAQLLLQLAHVGERYGNDILNPVARQGELLLLLMRHQLSMLLLLVLLRCNCCCQLILQWPGTFVESWLRFGIAVDRRVLLLRLRLRLCLRLWRLAERALIQFQLLWHSKTEAMRLLMLLQLQLQLLLRLMMVLMLVQMLLVLRELHWTRQHSRPPCATWWTVANVVVVVARRLYVIVLQLEASVRLSVVAVAAAHLRH